MFRFPELIVTHWQVSRWERGICSNWKKYLFFYNHQPWHCTVYRPPINHQSDKQATSRCWHSHPKYSRCSSLVRDASQDIRIKQLIVFLYISKSRGNKFVDIFYKVDLQSDLLEINLNDFRKLCEWIFKL